MVHITYVSKVSPQVFVFMDNCLHRMSFGLIPLLEPNIIILVLNKLTSRLEEAKNSYS